MLRAYQRGPTVSHSSPEKGRSPIHIHAVVVMGWAAGFASRGCDHSDSVLRTSAAAAAADLASSPDGSPPPTVLPGPETLGFFPEPPSATRAGTEALVAGAGAEPRVRPGP